MYFKNIMNVTAIIMKVEVLKNIMNMTAIITMVGVFQKYNECDSDNHEG